MQETERKEIVWQSAALLALLVLLTAAALVFAIARALAKDVPRVELVPMGGEQHTQHRMTPDAARAYAEAHPRDIVLDDRNIMWVSEVAKLDLFSAEYTASDGVTLKAASGNGDKIVAPGTDESTEFALQNTAVYQVDYLVYFSAWTEPEGTPIPLELRMKSYAGDWIVGGEDSWVSISDLEDGVWTDTATLYRMNNANYTVEWRWPFERGTGEQLAANDAADTALGNSAEELKAHVQIRTTAWFPGPSYDPEPSYPINSGTGGSGGGKDGTYYPISDESGGGVRGVVRLPRHAAPAGELVTFSAVPEAGYKIEQVVVTTASGKTVPVKYEGGGVYSFVMPKEAVNIYVSFVPILELPDGMRYLDGWRHCMRDHTCPDAVFSDLNPKEWYHDGTHFCVENGIMIGFPDGFFYPNGNVTRAQIVLMLYRWYDGDKAELGDVDYDDAVKGEWYYTALVWADRNNIVNGYGDGTFRPNAPITREQLGAIFYRYARFVASDVSATADLERFSDRPAISAWAEEASRWAAGSGLIEGRPGSLFAPQDNASRAEAATMMWRWCTQIEQIGQTEGME